MPSNTVAQFAEELNMPANVLLEQFRSAGVELDSVDAGVTDADKAALLEALQRSHGTSQGKKLTLTRRKTSEIHQADGSGRSRTIQVEVRKKRVFVKRDAADLLETARAEDAAAQTPAVEPESAPVAPQAEAPSPAPQAEVQAEAATPVAVPEPEAPAVQASDEAQAAPTPEPEPVVEAPEPAPEPEQ